jgi:hypothetical protein
MGHEPVVQDDLAVQPDFVTIAPMQGDKLIPCDARLRATLTSSTWSVRW